MENFNKSFSTVKDKPTQNPNKKGKIFWGLGLLLPLLVLFLLSFCFLNENLQAQKKTDEKTADNKTSNEKIDRADKADKKELPGIKWGDPLPANAFIELARVVNPAVVNISTSILMKRRAGQGSRMRDPFLDLLEQFYGFQGRGNGGGSGMGPGLPQMKPQQALGTGFIIREDGLIVTNNHVISGADVIQVQLSEKSEKKYEAKVIGSDDRTDIALLKIEGKSFPTLQLGSSKETEVGEWVAAFGNPLGNGHTMTKGIISAKGRDINDINKFPLLQTDTPINPGNSGGPLVNLKGQVIGVNSAIAAGAQGIGFAIPIDEVKTVIPQLEKHGHLKKAYLGVGLADLDPQTAAYLGMKDLEGALIAQVEKGGPADKAGLRAYDIVTEINGKKIKDSNALRDTVADSPVNQVISVKLLREGRPKTIKITLADRPDFKQARSQTTNKFYGEKAPHGIGFMMTDANDQVRKDFQLNSDVNKPVIVDVTPDSLAAQSGLMPGDIILDVNRKDVTNTSQVIKNIKKGTNTMRLVRQEVVLFVMFEVK